MSTLPPDLERLGRKIERLTLDPESISDPVTWLVRPLMHRIGWRPKTKIDAIKALIAQLEWVRERDGDAAECRKLLEEATDELEDNLQQIERATVLDRRPLVAHAAWLRRLFELVVHAQRAVASTKDRSALFLAASPDEALMLPPLSMRTAREEIPEDAPSEGAPKAPGFADASRVLELQLDTVDHLMAAARSEDALLGRRRRLLDAARQLLLETSAALALDKEGVQKRLENIALQITRINRQQAVGLRPDVALLHQARTALSRGERDKLFAALSAIRRGAVDRGDIELTTLSGDGLDRLTGRASSSNVTEASLGRSAAEVFGGRAVDAIAEGYRRARVRDQELDEMNSDSWAAARVADYFAPGKERDTLAHALTVDGCFDVGGALSPVRVEEHYIRHRVVPYPTPELRLQRATGPEDLPTALIDDPRAVILNLAAGRLLSRRFVQEDVATRTKTLMQGEVRVYVLDGSSSMLGPRARMRDSILVAELATLLRRLENPQAHTRVVLYYRYFNHDLGPVTRVDTPGGVIEAIADVVGRPRSGRTDIEAALLSSLELIAEAQREDSDLARAQIVLITDGNAPIDEELVVSAREVLGALPVGVSVIALGEENPALRNVVARQRARRERAFYHFLGDDYLARVSWGKIGDDPVHLPSVPHHDDASTLTEKLGPLLEDLAQLQRSREAEARRELDRSDRERRIERADVEAAGEGERARLEALYRDDLALERRYAQWFPRPAAPPPDEASVSTALVRAAPDEGTLERDDLDSALVVLATIAEVVEAVGSHRLGRQADAVDLLERLLPNARLTPARYHEVLRGYPFQIAPALEAVHGAVQSGLGWRIDAGAQR
jgi:hypothetical protein